MCAFIEKESLYKENKQNNRITGHEDMRIIALGRQNNDKTVIMICLQESIVYKQLA